jgi:hypothetical protein
MVRGGNRQGAGRKSGWTHSETTVIRVPKIFAGQLTEIAQKLDRSEYLDSVSKSEKTLDDLVTESLVQLIFNWEAKANDASPKSSCWVKARQMLAEMKSILDGEKAVIETVSKSKVSSAQLNISAIESELVLNNESVTKSIDGVGSPLSGKDLSKRFGLGRTAAWDAKKRCAGNTKEFFEWSKGRDPNGVGWDYNEQTRKYYPVF